MDGLTDWWGWEDGSVLGAAVSARANRLQQPATSDEGRAATNVALISSPTKVTAQHRRASEEGKQQQRVFTLNHLTAVLVN